MGKGGPSLAASTLADQAIQAEQALLGAVIMTNSDWFTASEIVGPEHFIEPIHAELWRILSEQIERGSPCTPITLQAALGKDAAAKIGNLTIAEYIARLISEAFGQRGTPHAQVVFEMSQRRQLAALARELEDRATGAFSGRGIVSVLDEADASINAIRLGKSTGGVVSLEQALSRAVNATAKAYQSEKLRGFGTGIATLDELTGTILPGHMLTILGASGHGKSALAQQILLHNSAPEPTDLVTKPEPVPVAYMSMEMDAVDIAQRALASYAKITTERQALGEISPGEFDVLVDEARRLSTRNFHIDDSGRQTCSQIIKKMRLLKKKYGIRLYAIDHAKIIEKENPRWSEVDTIADAAPRLKDAAKELDAGLILLAQVTRDSQKRSQSWRVRSSQLFGGEVVKECSDAMVGVAIPGVWLRENEPDPNADERDRQKWVEQVVEWRDKAELANLKRRHGASGGYRRVAYDGARTWFSPLA